MRDLSQASLRHDRLRLDILPLRTDNYSYIVTDETAGSLVIDPSETAPIIAFLEKANLKLRWVLDTHHHGDHIEGNVGLQERFGAEIAASAYDCEKQRITGRVSRHLREGDSFRFGGATFEVLETPGHTLGHICLYLKEAGWLFSGDSLFSLGCGRLFEGDAAQLWNSFLKLRALPDDTLVFCGHEYTLANARFITELFPDWTEFAEFRTSLEARLARDGTTIPSRLGDEKRFNPYFLCDRPELKAYGSTPTEVFQKIRNLKNAFG